MNHTSLNNKDDDEDVLPGFRFHPTDEELLGFYLRRKVEKKPIGIELIKQIDIYKYDPWDLQKISTVGDQEWYFFCTRGRKYRNSIRPNRVTGSGFWKATGIDKLIYSDAGNDECIGLKKSLVYYRGSAGKGTKTDWMLHEYRLPPTTKSNNHSAKNIDQEAEVLTLCRIFKRIPSHKKYIPDSKETIIKQNPTDSSSKSCSLESDISEQFASFAESSIHENEKNKIREDQTPLSPSSDYYSSFFWSCNNGDDFFRDPNWDDLRSVVAHVSNYT